MRAPTRMFALVAASAAIGLASAAAEADGVSRGRPTRVDADMVLVSPGPDADARGGVAVKFFPANARRAERSWLRMRMGKLDGTDYSLWMDDPATPETDLVQVTTFVTHGRGNARLRFDTKHEETLPHGGTLETLKGMAFEIRDVTGAAVLNGTVPAVQ